MKRRISCAFLVLAALCSVLGATQARQPAQKQEEARPLPQAVKLPVGEQDVWVSDQSGGVDRQATVTPVADGGFLLVYAQYQHGDIDSSRLWQISSLDGRSVSSPARLSFGGEVEDGPVYIRSNGGTWLYFASSDAGLGTVRLWRARADGARFAAPQRLSDAQGLNRLSQLPRWVGSGKDVMLTFRGDEAGPQWQRWHGGDRPGESIKLVSSRVAYPRVVPMGKDGCFFSFQRPPSGGYMATYYSVSRDCAVWSEPVELSPPKAPNKADVHDAFALPRQDGGTDVYYVYPSFKGKAARFPVGFDLYRRSVGIDGSLGPEQLLTDRLHFNPFAPSAHRLADGSVLVSFSDIQENGAQGVARARLTLFRIQRDAPTPVPD